MTDTRVYCWLPQPDKPVPAMQTLNFIYYTIGLTWHFISMNQRRSDNVKNLADTKDKRVISRKQRGWKNVSRRCRFCGDASDWNTTLLSCRSLKGNKFPAESSIKRDSSFIPFFLLTREDLFTLFQPGEILRSKDLIKNRKKQRSSLLSTGRGDHSRRKN